MVPHKTLGVCFFSSGTCFTVKVLQDHQTGQTCALCSLFSLYPFYWPFFQGGPGLANTRIFPFWILLELRMMEVVVCTGAIRCAKASVKSSPPTNQSPTFYSPDVLPFAQPTVSEH